MAPACGALVFCFVFVPQIDNVRLIATALFRFHGFASVISEACSSAVSSSVKVICIFKEST